MWNQSPTKPTPPEKTILECNDTENAFLLIGLQCGILDKNEVNYK